MLADADFQSGRINTGLLERLLPVSGKWVGVSSAIAFGL
jgi:hypothetical protein